MVDPLDQIILLAKEETKSTESLAHNVVLPTVVMVAAVPGFTTVTKTESCAEQPFIEVTVTKYFVVTVGVT